MLPYRVSNPGPLTYESGALPIALRGPAIYNVKPHVEDMSNSLDKLFDCNPFNYIPSKTVNG